MQPEETREKPDYEIARDEMRALLDSLGVSVECEFVPLSRSRNAGEKHPTVNWRVTVRKERVGRRVEASILTCDYSQGVAHLLGFEKMRAAGWERSTDGVAAIRSACENHSPRDPRIRAVAPSREDVLSSLALDAGAIDYATFEDWAGDYGYDPDSRKGEAIYRQCLKTALELRAAFGDEVLAKLRDLAGRF